MRVSLEAFMRTGAFGAIELGASSNEVARILGEPQMWSSEVPDAATAAIWKYGDVEFYFQDEVLWMIFCDDFTLPRGGAALELDTWVLSGDLSCAQAQKHLSAAAIPYRVEEFPTNENGVRLVADSGATLSFASEDGSAILLRSFLRQLTL